MHIAAAVLASLVWFFSIVELAASGLKDDPESNSLAPMQSKMIGIGAAANLIAIALICYAVA